MQIIFMIHINILYANKWQGFHNVVSKILSILSILIYYKVFVSELMFKNSYTTQNIDGVTSEIRLLLILMKRKLTIDKKLE